jgi:hypothetical protein
MVKKGVLRNRIIGNRMVKNVTIINVEKGMF